MSDEGTKREESTAELDETGTGTGDNTPAAETIPVASEAEPAAEETVSPAPESKPAEEHPPVTVTEPEGPAEPVSSPVPPVTEPSQPAGDGSPQFTSPPPPTYQPASGYEVPAYTPPAPSAPKTMETAFAFLFFLGFFGGHKFYMGQSTLGLIYLLVGVGVMSVLSIPFIGQVFGVLFVVALLLNLYADIRTMRDQLSISEMGKQLSIDDQIQFFKRAFRL